jgi:hypothetical protein
MCTGFVERSAKSAQPLSIIAVNQTTGAVDGAMINEDFCLPTPNSYRHLGPGWRATRAIFKSLHETFNATHSPTPQPGEFMHTVYFTCVRHDARGQVRPPPTIRLRLPSITFFLFRCKYLQKVMQGLWRNTIDVARENSYPSIVAESSTEDVRQVCLKFAFVNPCHFVSANCLIGLRHFRSGRCRCSLNTSAFARSLPRAMLISRSTKMPVQALRGSLRQSFRSWLPSTHASSRG